VDLFCLSWQAKEYDFCVDFIQLAAKIDDNMPYYTLSRLVEALGDRGTAFRAARLLMLGGDIQRKLKGYS